ncbi:MAG: hypothetical protein KatS3mg001_024 [Candidatus Pacearchaeota archaeon]|nr:MAG: hypothetical protein KatS3mg001_024 [Candidatus Pacearchaeota archaeon]
MKFERKKLLILVILAIILAFTIIVIVNIKNNFSEKEVYVNYEGSILENIKQYESDLRQITCYCGCEHTDLYNCYEEGMLTECGLCMKEYETYLEMRPKYSIQEISDYIDNKWGDNERGK